MSGRDQLCLVIGRDLKEDEWRGPASVSVQRKNGLVFVQVGNGGDFGESEMWLTPEDARRLAQALLDHA